MARTVLYHGVHIQTGNVGAAQTLTIVRDGTIRGIKFSTTGTGGAAAGFYTASAELNNASQNNSDQNQPPRETVLATHMYGFGPTTTVTHQSPIIPVVLKVRTGDTITIMQGQTGTAATTNRVHVDVIVEES